MTPLRNKRYKVRMLRAWWLSPILTPITKHTMTLVALGLDDKVQDDGIVELLKLKLIKEV